MGWHYRKSIKVGPFRVNLSRRGVGHSVGNRRIRVSTSPDGRRHVTLRLPGGFRLGKTFGGRRRY
ncbi:MULTISPECIES: DUF4236 domain-containing protein [Nonomuraea]|uniref:DUF4236 domain-containing protein n=2 Tax=Nonomuraea TaxID=83681 RepID=A0ABW1BNH5_9ACTN|nr:MULTISPECIES: DUF4236 domain-containing protein [Nonomuraea]MDA0647024.1 DUF4236 domain-containing protein [Nonomuraea ferruginea]TXK39250.1 DUF4236 domain-containing protein [Nonomuraea sp. C10]